MGFFGIFKKNTSKGSSKEFRKLFNDNFSYDKELLLALLSEHDEFHTFRHKNNCFTFVFDKHFSHYIAQNSGKIRIKSFLFSFDEIPCKTTEKSKYIVRIYFDERAKVFVIYNIESKMCYYVICEKDENSIYSSEIIGEIQIYLVNLLDDTNEISTILKLNQNLVYFCTK